MKGAKKSTLCKEQNEETIVEDIRAIPCNIYC